MGLRGHRESRQPSAAPHPWGLGPHGAPPTVASDAHLLIRRRDADQTPTMPTERPPRQRCTPARLAQAATATPDRAPLRSAPRPRAPRPASPRRSDITQEGRSPRRKACEKKCFSARFLSDASGIRLIDRLDSALEMRAGCDQSLWDERGSAHPHLATRCGSGGGSGRIWRRAARARTPCARVPCSYE